MSKSFVEAESFDLCQMSALLMTIGSTDLAFVDTAVTLLRIQDLLIESFMLISIYLVFYRATAN